jgi:hypothetical protein
VLFGIATVRLDFEASGADVARGSIVLPLRTMTDGEACAAPSAGFKPLDYQWLR